MLAQWGSGPAVYQTPLFPLEETGGYCHWNVKHNYYSWPLLESGAASRCSSASPFVTFSMSTCTGTESNLNERGTVTVSDTTCRYICPEGRAHARVEWFNTIIYSADLKVLCIGNCLDGALRLVGGSTDREGRVEVCVGDRWGTVQSNLYLEAARTVCRSQSQILSFYSTSPCYGLPFYCAIYNCCHQFFKSVLGICSIIQSLAIVSQSLFTAAH